MKSKSARRSVRPDKTSRRPSQRLDGEHGWNSASRRSKPIRSMMSTTSTSASAANKRYEGARPPAGYKTSISICRKFLNEHAPKKADGETAGKHEPKPVSPAQMLYAKKIAQGKGLI